MSTREPGRDTTSGLALLPSDTDPGLDHAALERRSVLLGSLLSGMGMETDDVVAVMAGQSNAVYELLFGVRRAGLVFLEVDPSRTLEQNAFAINTSGARVFIAGAEHSAAAQALVPLTPYIQARFGLDGDFFHHRSLPLARSAAALVPVQAEPAGTLHHVIGTSGRPLEVRLADPVADIAVHGHCVEMLGGLTLHADSVLVSSTRTLAPGAAMLAAAVLAAGGGVAVPRNSTGVETLRTAFAVDATIIHLDVWGAAEVAALEPQRVLRLTPHALERVILDGYGSSPEVLSALTELWGTAVRVARQAYLDVAQESAAERDCSLTQAVI